MASPRNTSNHSGKSYGLIWFSLMAYHYFCRPGPRWQDMIPPSRSSVATRSLGSFVVIDQPKLPGSRHLLPQIGPEALRQFLALSSRHGKKQPPVSIIIRCVLGRIHTKRTAELMHHALAPMLKRTGTTIHPPRRRRRHLDPLPPQATVNTLVIQCIVNQLFMPVIASMCILR